MFFIVDTTGYDGPSLTGPFDTYDAAFEWLRRVRPDVAEDYDNTPDVWVAGVDDPTTAEAKFKTGEWTR